MANTTYKGPLPGQDAEDGAVRIAYVRAVDVETLGPDVETPEGLETVYALHDPTGRRLALFDNRDLAFAVARSNQIEAVSVH